jgi:hypothetical protein
MGGVLAAALVWPIYLAIPSIILYFIIKIAVKKAIKELKDDNVIM